MTSFLIPAALLLILVLVLLLRPLFFPERESATSRRQMNAAIYREELDKLDADRLAGRVDGDSYEQTHAEMRQRLFQDTDEADDLAVLGSTKKTIIGLCLFVVLLSSGFYFYLGDASRIAEKSTEKPMTQESVEKMIVEFAAKMEKDPDNLKGWAMLARSYRILGRNAEAANAYVRAGSFIDSDPQLLADYADVLAANANGNFAGKPQQLINKALALDPNNLLALWLSGTAAFNVQNYKAAVQSWEKIAIQLPPDTDEARAIASSIAEARNKGGIAPASAPVISNQGVSGRVGILSALESKVKAGDTLMVIARKPGERMPVAVLKTAVTAFPISFVLNDSLAMSPNALISQLPEVSVEVRISKSGMAMPESGDLISAPQTIKVGTTNARLLIDQIRP
ncbi:MAG: c-type cytochrome biogenesis protein CcmI [Polynucleobacter sp. 24-46-87]|uniref:c-type cytochrome biogenesis protein CcmI n=1 Tax=unclassified Polynucleobacter TaxID=2640945 RepID=UPI000BC5859F|nr:MULTISPECIES: c-type cytochrome biogenesis protein CcmI [unclassified Polynucleobacter]OYY21676.1 MAG: c-type cytochrome biogenesis protein CcmI [Polynucleobacter sp. 35-46-11]OZA16044.1 MAG: c-type cytochrome biogenesis protein CcmI [Polynucleobacter sp. 24-46-87]OZA78317.1 MAG: c-type cytochrome biogenesis protein CcmI [Polynucleobacter sp. 39-46-10]